MAMTKSYFAQAFKPGARGRLDPMTPQPVKGSDEAKAAAERLAARYVGAVAVVQEADRENDIYGEVEIIARFGRTPQE